MFCMHCGAEIMDENANFCRKCGQPVKRYMQQTVTQEKENTAANTKASTVDYTDLTARIKTGDTEAFRQIYEVTYRDMYYLALKLTKSKEAAEDVLQDAYLRVWNHIDTLKDPAAFRGWLSRIVSNTAKNMLMKKTPLLFSQLEGEDEDGDAYAFDIPDEDTDVQPELNYTEKETQALVHEMIDSLSDEQRFCVLMFYLENQSIREIAETLDVSENTVKSRLNYGRKNLAKKAEELKKKGYILFSITPLTLLMLLHQEKSSSGVAYAASAAMRTGSETLIPQIKSGFRELQGKGTTTETTGTASGKAGGAASHGGTATATTASNQAGSAASHVAAVTTQKAFYSTVAGKIAIAAVSLAVAGGIFLGGSAFGSHFAQKNNPAVVESSTEASNERNGSETSESEENGGKVQSSESENSSEKAQSSESENSSEKIQASEQEKSKQKESSSENPDEGTGLIALEDFPNLICGSLTEYELETVLAYGPEEGQTGLTEGKAQGILNELVQAVDWETGEARVQSSYDNGSSCYDLEEINRYFSSFGTYQFTSGNGFITINGSTLSFAPAQIDFTADANITQACMEDGNLVIYYDYNYNRAEDPGIREAETVNCQKKAVFTKQDDGKYRLLRTEEVN